MAEKFRRKPFEIEAMFNDGTLSRGRAIAAWANKDNAINCYVSQRHGHPGEHVVMMRTSAGDETTYTPCYIVKWPDGRFQSYDVEEFLEVFEPSPNEPLHTVLILHQKILSLKALICDNPSYNDISRWQAQIAVLYEMIDAINAAYLPEGKAS